MRGADGYTPFDCACYVGKFHNVKIILKNSKEYNINIYLTDGQDLAEQQGHTKIVKLIKTWKHSGFIVSSSGFIVSSF